MAASLDAAAELAERFGATGEVDSLGFTLTHFGIDVIRMWHALEASEPDQVVSCRDYSSCDDGLGGALKVLSAAQAVTGGTVVTESRTPETVAEVVAIVAHMPDVDAANLVRDSRVSCRHKPGRPTAIRLADGSQTLVIQLDGGTPTDPYGRAPANLKNRSRRDRCLSGLQRRSAGQ